MAPEKPKKERKVIFFVQSQNIKPDETYKAIKCYETTGDGRLKCAWAISTNKGGDSGCSTAVLCSTRQREWSE